MPSPTTRKPRAKPAVQQVPFLTSARKPVAKRPAPRRRARIPKKPPPFSIKRYIEESLVSISSFFQFVFAGNFAPRQKQLLDASITFIHYN